MTDRARELAAQCLEKIWDSMDTHVANRFRFAECHDLTPMYQWCSRDLNLHLLDYTTPIFTLLFMPQNRTRLSTILLNDPNAVSHFSKCLQNFWNHDGFYETRNYMFSSLMDLLKSVNPKAPLFTVLYDSSVLVQLWKFLLSQRLNSEKFFLVVKSKLDEHKLDDLYAAMAEQARSSEIPNFPYALKSSAHEFGQIICVSHSQLKSTTEQSAPKADNLKDHDTEELAQASGANEGKGFHSIANWTKKAFGSVWPKTSVKSQ